jgi:hypothetical protein
MKGKGCGINQLWPKLRYSASICLEGLRKVVSIYSPSLGRDLNPGAFYHSATASVKLHALFSIDIVSVIAGRSRGNSVSIVSGYGLDDRAIEVRSPAEAKGFFL